MTAGLNIPVRPQPALPAAGRPGADRAALLAAARRTAVPLAGTAVVLLVWQCVGWLRLLPSDILPDPSQILAALAQVWPTASADLPGLLSMAAEGYLLGNGAAIALALLAGLSRPAHALIARLGVAAHCLPTIALAPVLLVVASGHAAGVILAALGVFFATLVSMTSGLRNTDPRAVEAAAAYNAGPVAVLVKVRLPGSLPGLFTGLQLAAPMAVVGALITQYLYVGSGFGAAVVGAQEAGDTARVWALCLCVAVVSSAAFGIVATARRTLLPWVAEAPVGYAAATGAASRPNVRALLAAAGDLAAFLLIACLAWWGALRVFGIVPYLGKTPADVAGDLAGPGAAGHWSTIWAALSVTLVRAFEGLAAGTAAGVALAAAFAALPLLRASLTPAVLAFRSIPLLAMVPAIDLAFRGGSLTVIFFTGLLAFFPTLVTVTAAFDAVPAEVTRVAHAFNASRWQVTAKVRAAYAVPAILQALKITATGALLGAVVTEWLATANGFGYLMLQAGDDSDYTTLWAAVTVITLASMAVYAAVSALEDLVRHRLF